MQIRLARLSAGPVLNHVWGTLNNWRYVQLNLIQFEALLTLEGVYKPLELAGRSHNLHACGQRMTLCRAAAL